MSSTNVRILGLLVFSLGLGCGGPDYDPPTPDLGMEYATGSDGLTDLSISGALTVNKTYIVAGQTLTASITYRNPSSSAVSIAVMAITARRPGATHAGGPYDDFSPVKSNFSITAGGSVTLTASRLFTSSDPTGRWEVYSTYQDSAGGWHDNSNAAFVDVGASTARLWVTANYAAWNGTLTPDKIDFSAVTHVNHFSVVPKTNGSLDTAINGWSPSQATALVNAAHAAGKRVILSVGGWGSDVGFLGAMSDANRASFVQNLASMVSTYGYDGIDLDMEPEPESAGDQALYTQLFKDVRAKLNTIRSGLLLTASAAAHAAMWSGIASQLDQLNLMAYDLSGLWIGESWHNSPLQTGGIVALNGWALPSDAGMISDFLAAGISAAKLGLGMPFYGYVWRGVYGPNQSAAGLAYPEPQAYVDIVATYFASSAHLWHSPAQVPYLSVNQTGTANDLFISYDDATSLALKVGYAAGKGMGGVMIWELGHTYDPSAAAGQQNPLLTAVKNAAFGSGSSSTPPPPTPGKIEISTALQLDRASYAVGSRVTGTVTYKNTGGSSITIASVGITARPPGGTHSGGPYDDFSPWIGQTTLAPGATVTVRASYVISGPTGTWECFSTYKDMSGGWHDGPSIWFSVTN